ncbi:MAG: hypothetical protein GX375_00825 [Clostridiales bacterium]|nr:hypothetical protein [Clostridiales bacterium]
MARRITIAGRRIRFRFFVFLAIFFAFAFFGIKLAFKPPLYDIIQYGELNAWNEYPGIVIRDEEVYTAPDYGKVDFFVSKGQIVDKDTLLAVLYKDNYNQELVEQLYKTKQRIWDYQNRNMVQEMMDSDYETIQENIVEVMRNMQYSIHAYAAQDMENYENQLRRLLHRKKEIFHRMDSTSNYLEQLYQEEGEIESKLDEWKVEIVAPKSGIISFEIDGLEKILTPNDIDYLTRDQYLSFSEHEAPVSHDENSEIGLPLYRLVESDKWYLVSLIPHKKVYYEQGDRLNLKLLGLSENPISSTVYRVDFSEDSTLVILEITDGIETVIESRKIYVEIETRAQGLMVPRGAIINQKDSIGVKVIANGDIQFVRVKVKAMDDDWAIIDKINDMDNLEVNDRILIQ